MILIYLQPYFYYYSCHRNKPRNLIYLGESLKICFVTSHVMSPSEYVLAIFLAMPTNDALVYPVFADVVFLKVLESVAGTTSDFLVAKLAFIRFIVQLCEKFDKL